MRRRVERHRGARWYSESGIARLNAELNKALNSPTLRERFAAIGADPSPSTPEAFAAFIKSENEKWRDVVKRSGAKVD